MKNLKKFYQNNRIYCILMIISAICLIVILVTIIGYFAAQTHSSNYGNRLDGLENYAVDNEVNEVKSFFSGNQRVKNVNTDIRGKIIYINVEVDKDMANEDIQTLCTESLTKFKDDQKEYYDIQYIVKRDGLSPYLGSKSASKTVIAWANFSYNNEEENQDTEGE